jgi:hypothetical protein
MNTSLLQNRRSRSAFTYNRISRPVGSSAACCAALPTPSVTSPVFAGYELAHADRRLSEAVHACVLILSVIATCVLLVLG